MEGNWASSVMKILDQITKLVFINLLWVLFTLIGLGIFGLMPATASVNYFIRRSLQEKELSNIMSHFWRVYKESFISSNILGFLFAVVATVLYLDYRILLGTNAALGKFFLSFIILLMIIFLAVIVNFFPIYSKYDMRIIDYLKTSLLTAMIHPFATMAMFLWLFIVVYLCLRFSVLLPLLSIVLLFLGFNWIHIKYIEPKKLHKNLSKQIR